MRWAVSLEPFRPAWLSLLVIPAWCQCKDLQHPQGNPEICYFPSQCALDLNGHGLFCNIFKAKGGMEVLLRTSFNVSQIVSWESGGLPIRSCCRQLWCMWYMRFHSEHHFRAGTIPHIKVSVTSVYMFFVCLFVFYIMFQFGQLHYEFNNGSSVRKSRSWSRNLPQVQDLMFRLKSWCNGRVWSSASDLGLSWGLAVCLLKDCVCTCDCTVYMWQSLPALPDT